MKRVGLTLLTFIFLASCDPKAPEIFLPGDSEHQYVKLGPGCNYGFSIYSDIELKQFELTMSPTIEPPGLDDFITETSSILEESFAEGMYYFKPGVYECLIDFNPNIDSIFNFTVFIKVTDIEGNSTSVLSDVIVTAPVPHVYLDCYLEDSIVEIDRPISVNIRAVSEYLYGWTPLEVDFNLLKIKRDGFEIIDFSTGIFSPENWYISTENPDIYKIVPGEWVLNGQVNLVPNRLGAISIEIEFENIYGNSRTASLTLYSIN